MTCDYKEAQARSRQRPGHKWQVLRWRSKETTETVARENRLSPGPSPLAWSPDAAPAGESVISIPLAGCAGAVATGCAAHKT